MTKHESADRQGSDRPGLQAETSAVRRIDPSVLQEAERLIARWDREGGLSYRELAFDILSLHKIRGENDDENVNPAVK